MSFFSRKKTKKRKIDQLSSNQQTSNQSSTKQTLVSKSVKQSRKPLNVSNLSTRFYRRQGGSASRKINDAMAQYRTLVTNGDINSYKARRQAYSKLNEIASLLGSASKKKAKEINAISMALAAEKSFLAEYATTTAGIESGAFDLFLENGGFNPQVNELVQLKDETDEVDYDKVAEEIWRMVARVRTNKGDVVARELLKAINKNIDLGPINESYLSGAKEIKLNIEGENAMQSVEQLEEIRFGETGITLTLGQKLGEGGFGAVYKAIGSDGKEYAVKRESGKDYRNYNYGKNPVNNVRVANSILSKMYEGDVTTTCLDYTVQGKDKYYLLELGTKPDFTQLNMSDIVSLFNDLDKLDNYSSNHMQTEIVQDVGVFHYDIHKGNMMLFNNKMRLVDFGRSVIFDTNLLQEYKTVTNTSDSTNIQVMSQITPDGSIINGYISNWQNSLPENDPRKNQAIQDITPDQFNNLVMLANLIKIIVGDIKASGKLQNAPSIGALNKEIYPKTKTLLPYLKQEVPEQAGQVELLMQWFDTVMTKIVNGEEVSSKDAVAFFGGQGIERGRSATI